MKGGVGKTTVAALLGRYASNENRRVLVVDLDPQANLSQAYMGDEYGDFLESQEPSIVEVFEGYRPPTRHSGSSHRLEYSEAIRNVHDDGTLAFIPSRFDFSDNLVSALKPDPKVLSHFIADHCSDRDLVLIDCPPTESIFTRAAYHASRYVLVPVRPEYFATVGFPLLVQSLTSFKRERPAHNIEVLGIVINNSFYRGSNDGGPEKQIAMSEIQRETEKNHWHVFDNQIPHSRGFPKLMRGDRRWRGNSFEFINFAEEFFDRLDRSGENQ